MEAEKIDEIGKDFHLCSFSFMYGEILVTDLTNIIVLWPYKSLTYAVAI